MEEKNNVNKSQIAYCSGYSSITALIRFCLKIWGKAIILFKIEGRVQYVKCNVHYIHKWYCIQQLIFPFLYVDDSTYIILGDSVKDFSLKTNVVKNVSIPEELDTWEIFWLNEWKTQQNDFGLNISTNQDALKLLGVYFDVSLLCNAYIDYLSKKLSRCIYLMRQLSFEVLRTAYYGIFDRVMVYGLLFEEYILKLVKYSSFKRNAFELYDMK